jgi:hypothetical protein
MSASDFFFGTCLPPRRDPGVEALPSEIRHLIPRTEWKLRHTKSVI